MFIAAHLGPRDLTQHIQTLVGLSGVSHVVILDKQLPPMKSSKFHLYDVFTKIGQRADGRRGPTLADVEARVKSTGVLNIQFTSGTTGNPKAALLTHQ